MKILFQGDSVTDASRIREDFHDLGEGYPKYTAELLKSLMPETDFEFINRGVSGNRTKDVLARIQPDLIDIDPDIVTILIGVNDTWRRYDSDDPTTPGQFRENYENILKTVKEKTRAKIVMIECFLIYGMGRDHYREDLNPKLDITRELAMKYADAFIPLDGMLAQASVGKDAIAPEEISADGVHPAEKGRILISRILAPVIANLIESTK